MVVFFHFSALKNNCLKNCLLFIKYLIEFNVLQINFYFLSLNITEKSKSGQGISNKEVLMSVGLAVVEPRQWCQLSSALSIEYELELYRETFVASPLSNELN